MEEWEHVRTEYGNLPSIPQSKRGNLAHTSSQDDLEFLMVLNFPPSSNNCLPLFLQTISLPLLHASRGLDLWLSHILQAYHKQSVFYKIVCFVCEFSTSGRCKRCCVLLFQSEELEADVELVLSIMDELTEELIKEGPPPPLPPPPYSI